LAQQQKHLLFNCLSFNPSQVSVLDLESRQQKIIIKTVVQLQVVNYFDSAISYKTLAKQLLPLGH
jgi:hypothetical protein